MRKCSVEGCQEKHEGRGLCKRHYGAWWRHGNPLAPVRTISGPYPPGITCLVQACDRRPVAKDLCLKHYKRLRNHGDPNVVLRTRTEPVHCIIPGCTSPIASYHMCKRHYDKWLRYGDASMGTDYIPNCKGPNTCTIDGCNRKAEARGYCHKHYYAHGRYGDPLYVQNKRISRRAKVCRKAGCRNLATHKSGGRAGFCRVHYNEFRKMSSGNNLIPRKHVEYFSRGCWICSYSKTPRDLHHIAAGKDGIKDNSLGNLAELCPNCHREAHRGLVSQNMLSRLNRTILPESARQYAKRIHE